MIYKDLLFSGILVLVGLYGTYHHANKTIKRQIAQRVSCQMFTMSYSPYRFYPVFLF